MMLVSKTKNTCLFKMLFQKYVKLQKTFKFHQVEIL